MARPTIRAIAQAAEVSGCTVSRALRDDPHLSEKTRKRIQEIARQMGYIVNPYVSSWMAHVRSTKTDISFQGCLAYLNYHKNPLPLTMWSTPRMQLKGASARALELGYRIEHLAIYRDGLTSERSRQILTSRAIKGILFPVSGELADIDIPLDSFACVAIGHHMTNPPIHYTSTDHHTMIVMGCHELAKRGYRRTGMIFSDDNNKRLELRPSSAFLGWQNQFPKTQQVPPLIFKGRLGEEVLVNWCRRHKIDSVLCFEGVAKELIAKHFRVPEEIAVANLDWHTDCGMAGVDQQHNLIGAAAVDMLVHMLNNNTYGIPITPRATLVNSIWRDGPTAPQRKH